MDLLAINTPWHQAPVYYIESTSSTMDLAYKEIQNRAVSGTVIMAGHQTNGRGRFPTRKWESLKDQNLLFTLILSEKEYDFASSLIPLLAGYSLYQMLLNEFNIQTSLKWPNDILYESKKIAGILCESKSGYVLIGIGLNCNQKNFPSFGKIIPSSIKLILDNEVNIYKILEHFLYYFHKNILSGFDHEAVNKCLYNKNNIIKLSQGSKTITGMLSGINKEGALKIKKTGSLIDELYYAGEILYE